MADEQLTLIVPRSRAEEALARHMREGEELLDRANGVGNEEQYVKWDEDRHRWGKLTEEALKSIYSTIDPSYEFEVGARPSQVIGTTTNEKFGYRVEAIRDGINALRSLQERLEYIPGPDEGGLAGAAEAEPADPSEAQVFIVHGRDAGLKETVGRLLERAGDHRITILHEQPNAGLTLIEKFEEHASGADYAVVLLTPDDVGGLVESDGSEPRLSPRGRQNVVFELGFFVGRLGRSRVAILTEATVERPSDLDGLVYISTGDEAWRFKLLQELRNAGLSFDLNKLA